MGYCLNGLGWGGWGHMGRWGHMGGRGGGWIIPLLGLTLFIGAVVLLAVGAVWLARRSQLQLSPVGGSQSGPSGSGPSGPMETARRRLAAGEITPAEFEELRERLES